MIVTNKSRHALGNGINFVFICEFFFFCSARDDELKHGVLGRTRAPKNGVSISLSISVSFPSCVMDRHIAATLVLFSAK